MFREFKRHYHRTKRNRIDAAQTGGLTFKLESRANQGAHSSLEMPEKDLLARYLVSIQRYLNEHDPLYFRNTLKTITEKFPKVTSPGEIAEIEKAVETIESGHTPFNYNGKDFTEKDIFYLVFPCGLL